MELMEDESFLTLYACCFFYLTTDVVTILCLYYKKDIIEDILFDLVHLGLLVRIGRI